MPITRSFYRTHETPVGLADNTVASLLDVIGDPTGVIRTAMVADEWGFEEDGDKLSLTPPLSPNHRIILAGSDSSASPTMDAPDTFTAQNLLAGTANRVTGGTFDWEAEDAGYTYASGGNFSAYDRALGLNQTSLTHCRVLWNDHALSIWVWDAGSNLTVKALVIGGCFPKANAPTEDDGRLWLRYVMGGAADGYGTNMNVTGTAFGAASTNGIFRHGGANGNSHCRVRNPVSGAWQTCAITGQSTWANLNENNMSTIEGAQLADGIQMSLGGTGGNAAVGYLEGIRVVGNALSNARYQVSGTSTPSEIRMGPGVVSAQNAISFELTDLTEHPA
jgi:hypothetical protein